MLYWCFPFWLTSLCIIGSSFIHLILYVYHIFILEEMPRSRHEGIWRRSQGREKDNKGSSRMGSWAPLSMHLRTVPSKCGRLVKVTQGSDNSPHIQAASRWAPTASDKVQILCSLFLEKMSAMHEILRDLCFYSLFPNKGT